MKTWILKDSFVSYPPRSAFKAYSVGKKKSRISSEQDFANKSKQYFMVRRLRSQLKSLSKLLTYEAIVKMSTDY